MFVDVIVATYVNRRHIILSYEGIDSHVDIVAEFGDCPDGGKKSDQYRNIDTKRIKDELMYWAIARND